MKTPVNYTELDEAATLPFKEGNALISRANKGLVENWGRSLYSNFGLGFLHSSDHLAALRILLEREPTFAEVYRSWHVSGSKTIDDARKKQNSGRPSEWNSMDAQARRYAVLVHLYGIRDGSRILDGKKKDPHPDATQALLEEWSGGPVTPPAPPPPVEPPAPPPAPPKIDYKSLLVVLRGDLAAALEKVDEALRRR